VGNDVFGRALSPLVTPASSSDPSRWIGPGLLTWGRETGTRVCAVVPEAFEAYGRILHPAHGPAPDRSPIRWGAAAALVGCALHAETQWETIEEDSLTGGQNRGAEDDGEAPSATELRRQAALLIFRGEQCYDTMHPWRSASWRFDLY
jgi:hypothetical protein